MAITLPTKGDIVTFQLVVNTVNGGERLDVTVDAVNIGYSTAIFVDPELNSKHANLYPYFKDKVQGVNDPTAYNYLVLKGRNGKLEAVGIPWILDSSFKLIQGRRATITIENWQEAWDGPMRTFFAGLNAAIVVTKEVK